MATSAERNKPSNRPKKSDARKRSRRKLHEKRLLGLGIAPEKIVHLNTKQIRTMLRKPVKTAKTAAKLAAKKLA